MIMQKPEKYSTLHWVCCGRSHMTSVLNNIYTSLLLWFLLQIIFNTEVKARVQKLYFSQTLQIDFLIPFSYISTSQAYSAIGICWLTTALFGTAAEHEGWKLPHLHFNHFEYNAFTEFWFLYMFMTKAMFHWSVILSRLEMEIRFCCYWKADIFWTFW